jgi:hypothetical protein
MNSKHISMGWMILIALMMALIAFFGARPESVQAYEALNSRPCEVQMFFCNNQGKTLVREIQKLESGMATLLDVSYAAIGNPHISQ